MLKHLFRQILPHTCLLCGAPAKQRRDLCHGCEDELPWIQNPCRRCGLPLPIDLGNNQTCGICLKSLPSYDGTIALFEYQPPMDYAILQLKFHHRLAYARLMGELLSDCIKQHYASRPLPDTIIPVPLHPKRLRSRGFNQALEIARPISKALGIPINNSLCERTRNTETQSSVPAKKRKGNVRQAFRVAPTNLSYLSVSDTYVAVIDDVVTTGHTVSEVCRSLKKCGIAEIDIWCCARTSC